MSAITEEYLTRAKGNKIEAATRLVIDLSRGDARTFRLGYSFGSSLIAVTEHFNLTGSEIAIVAERVVKQTTSHYSATKQPLVIVGLDGGLIQWDIEKPGLGTPRFIQLDYDRDGTPASDLIEFADSIEEARKALASYDDPADKQALSDMADSIAEFRQRAAELP